ncbi:MAG: hypothetical protein WC968_02440 [Bacilli bacterium]
MPNLQSIATLIIVISVIIIFKNAYRRKNPNNAMPTNPKRSENSALHLQSRVVGYCPHCNGKIDSTVNQKCPKCADDYISARCGKCRNEANH